MTPLDRVVVLVLIIAIVCGLLGVLGQMAESRRLRRWLKRHCRWIELESAWMRWLP